jgi:ABC-type polysaccharide/polyol phosphate transport system ATPase subunit
MYSYGYHLEIKKANVKESKTWEEFADLLERVKNYSEGAFERLGFAIKPFNEVIKTIESIPKIINYEEMNFSLNNQPTTGNNKKPKI